MENHEFLHDINSLSVAGFSPESTAAMNRSANWWLRRRCIFSIWCNTFLLDIGFIALEHSRWKTA